MGLRAITSCLLFLAASAAVAQPYDAFFSVDSGHRYVQLPSSSHLNFFQRSFTFEAWVNNTAATTTGEDCRSVAGNQWTASTWIGICFGNKLRSYVSGSGSLYDAGDLRPNDWTHIAVTFDNATKTRRHYIDGELAGSRSDPAGITASTQTWRLFSDAAWERTLTGALDEVRFWNVARTQAQIRENITKSLSTEFGEEGILVNAVCPGWVDTHLWRRNAEGLAAELGAKSEEEARRLAARKNALNRFGRPEELANAIVFLCSERASYITGVSLNLDGGRLKSLW